VQVMGRRKKKTEYLRKGGNYCALNFEGLLFSSHFHIEGFLLLRDKMSYTPVAMVTFLYHFTRLLRLRYVLVCE